MDNVIEGNNEFLHIFICKKEDKYLVRNADDVFLTGGQTVELSFT